MNVKLCCCAIFLLIGIGVKSYAQNNLKGRVIDDRKAPVENVNIILYPAGSNEIINYTISDKSGNFNLSYPDGHDSLRLEVSSLGFEKQSLFYPRNHNDFLNITLKDAVNTLQEVVIKENPKPISVKKDTINYNVNAFADSSDRVIIDVIRKLPGIKVTPSGQILFNNKAINKFYIEGKDLLEDRYNIASNNLPSSDVEQVQVIPNHQPIKALEGELYSDRAAINIKLKKNAKLRLIGTGDIGVGAPPALRDDDLALLKFSKGIQFINTIKSNNIGINLDQELNDQNFSSNFYDSNSSKKDLVALVRPDDPPIDQYRYWFNNNNLINGNFLVSINKLLDLKVNAAFENDVLLENPRSTTNIYLPNDTITIKENHSGKKTYSKVLAGLTLEANTKDVYLKNTLKLQHIQSREMDVISPSAIDQSLNNPFTNLTNDLSAILKIRNNTIGLSSYTTYNNLPQQLSVTPGLYPDTLNGGQPYDGLRQNVQLKSFFSNNSASFTKQAGLFAFNEALGILVQSQTLSNNLYTEQTGLIAPVSGNFQNTIDRNRAKLYDNIGITFVKGAFNTSLTLKTSFNSLDSKSSLNNQRLSRFFINPDLAIRYRISNYFENAINLSTSNNLIDNANASFILYDYRDLVNNDSPINETASKNASYELIYKNIVRGIFANFNILYSHTTSNILTYNNYGGILTVSTFIVQNNPSSNLNASLNLGKYYDNIKTNLNIGVNYDSYSLEEIQEGILSHLKNDNYALNTGINTNISDAVAITHFLNLSLYKNATTQNNNTVFYDPLWSLRQDITLKIFFPKKIQTKFNVEQFYNAISSTNHSNYYFADVVLQKSFQKPKIDFSITLSNIFNTRSYSSYLYTNNILVSSNYPLRSRMLILKASFQF